MPLEDFGVDRRSVLRLGGDHDNIVGARCELIDGGDGIDLDDVDTRSHAQREPRLANGRGVRRPSDQNDVGAALP